MPSKPQIAKIFASLRELGWEREQLDDVVRQVSGGGQSVRELSTEQARQVIDVLVRAGARPGKGAKPRGRRTAPNEVLLITPAQHQLIADLRADIGGDWIRTHYFEGACRRRIGKPRPTTAGDATRVIEMMKQRLRHERGKAQ